MIRNVFQQETRDWLEANCPASMRTPMPKSEVVWGGRLEQFANPESRIWLERMAARGWIAPRWPHKFGGADLSADEARILAEELDRLNARPPLISFALSMLGPALMQYASEETAAFHLPQIAAGKIRWCQGYSEPDYGSDLAGVQMRAEDHGDHYLVNGAKIWTSYADVADWIFCLVRTDRDVPKQLGISFLLIDMATDGIATSRIDLISGSSPFCQVFFDNVRVPKSQLVGQPGQGWNIAKRLLEHERQWFAEIDDKIGHIIGVGGGTDRTLTEMIDRYLGPPGAVGDPVALRDRVARHDLDELALALTAERAGAMAAAGQPVDGSMASLFKYYGARVFKDRYEHLIAIMGLRGLGWDGPGFSTEELSITRQWLRSKGNSIEGGTSEIQLNIIAKRLLELPD